MRTKDFMPKHKKQDLVTSVLIFLLKLDTSLNKIQVRRIFINLYYKLLRSGDSYFNDIKRHVEEQKKKENNA